MPQTVRPPYEAFGYQLRRLRIWQATLYMGDVARRVARFIPNFSVLDVSDFEHGYRLPKEAELAALAQVLGADVDQLRMEAAVARGVIVLDLEGLSPTIREAVLMIARAIPKMDIETIQDLIAKLERKSTVAPPEA